MVWQDNRTGRHDTKARPPGGYPREKELRHVRLDYRLHAVIATEAAMRNTTIEAVIAERFGVPITPTRRNRVSPASGNQQTREPG